MYDMDYTRVNVICSFKLTELRFFSSLHNVHFCFAKGQRDMATWGIPLHQGQIKMLRGEAENSLWNAADAAKNRLGGAGSGGNGPGQAGIPGSRRSTKISFVHDEEIFISAILSWSCQIPFEIMRPNSAESARQELFKSAFYHIQRK